MVCQQHNYAAQTGLCIWQALKSGSIHTMACLRILVEQAKLMVIYAILLAILLALNTSPAIKCQNKFQSGMEAFLRDSSRYLREFQKKKSRKNLNG